MASPVWQNGATTAGTTAASLAVNLPTSIAANDVVIVTLYKENTNAVTPPAGWTEKTGTGVPPVVGTQQGQYTFWKRMAGGESGTVTFSWTGSVYTAALADRISGCATSGDPIEAIAGASSNTSSTSQPAVSLAATSANSLLYHAAGNFTGGDSQTAAPTGFTEREDLVDVLANSTKDNTAGGATGSLSGTWNLAATGQTAVVLNLLSDPAPGAGTKAYPAPPRPQRFGPMSANPRAQIPGMPGGTPFTQFPPRPSPATPPHTSVLSVYNTSSYASSATETTATPPLPSGWEPGDVVYIGWELTATTGTVTTPGGWTVAAGPVAASGVTNAHHGVLRRVMQAGDTPPAITFTSGRIAMVLVAVQAADQVTPEDVTSTTDDNTGVTTPSVRAPSITPVTDNCLLLTFHAVRNGTNGASTGFVPDATEAEAAETSSAVTGISNAAVEAAYLQLGTAAATGTKTATATGTVSTINMMGSAIAVRPVVSGVAGTATLSGSGTLGASPYLETPEQMSGLGTLSGSPVLAGSATMSGSGSLTASPVFSGSAALSGSGTLSATTILQSSATLSGLGTLSASPVISPAPASTLSGTGTLSASPYLSVPATLSGSGTLTGLWSAGWSATLSGSGTLSNVSVSLGIAMSGLGTLSAAPVFAATAALSGIGTLSAAPIRPVTATLTGLGTLSASPVFSGAATLSGSGTLQGLWTAGWSAALSGSGTLAASQGPGGTLSGDGTLTGIVYESVPGLLTGLGTLSASPVFSGTALMSGTGTLTASPQLVSAAVLSGLGTLQALPVFSPTALLSGLGTLSATARFAAAATFSGSGTLTAVTVYGTSVALSGLGTLTGTGTIPVVGDTGTVLWLAGRGPPRWHAVPLPSRWGSGPKITSPRWHAIPEDQRWRTGRVATSATAGYTEVPFITDQAYIVITDQAGDPLI